MELPLESAGIALFEPRGAWNAEAFLASLQRMGYRAVPAGTGTDRREYYDSRDGALRRAGYTLWHSQASHRWHLRGEGGEMVQDGEARPLPGSRGLAEALSRLCDSRPVFSCLRCEISETRWNLSSATSFPVGLAAIACMFTDPGCDATEARAVLLSLARARASTTEVRYLISLFRGALGLREGKGSIVQLGLERLGLPVPGGTLPPGLAPARDDTVSSAAVKVVRIQAFRMRANTPGAARDVDPEYVHDLRVATRRGRFALKLFSGILEPAFCASMRIELAWMAGLLGELRDLDVFAGRIERQFLRIESATGFRDGMAAWVASRRAEALQELQEAMRSPRYSRLLASLEETGEGGKDCEDDSGTGLSAFARSRISKAVRKLSSRAAIAAGAAGAAELHPVRILFKRLRYTCEFFRPYLGGRLSRLVELLVSFQDCLGAHQDACSAMGLLAAWQVEMPGVLSNSSHALSLGALLQLQRDERDSQSARFRELWASSADVLARWRSQRAAGAEE